MVELGVAILIWVVLVVMLLVLWARFWRHIRRREGLDEDAHIEGEDAPRGSGAGSSDVIRQFPQDRTDLRGPHGQESNELSRRPGAAHVAN